MSSFSQVVRGEQDRHALLARQVLDLLPQLGPCLGIEAGRRLVEEQHLRAVHQAHRDVEAALHPAGVRLDQPVGGLGERETLERRVHPPLQLGTGQPVELALEDEVLAAGRLGSKPCFWPTTPIAARTRRGSASTSRPATRALPASGRVSVVSTRTVVDLPAPFGPSRPKIVPASTDRLRPSSARTFGGYVFSSPTASIANDGLGAPFVADPVGRRTGFR